MSTWVNGLTDQTIDGIPPANWIAVSGSFVPPGVLPIDDGKASSGVFQISTATGVESIIVSSITLKVKISVAKTPDPNGLYLPVRIQVFPAIPIFAPYTSEIDTTLTINPIPLPFHSSIMNVVNALMDGKVENYFDQDRVLKTLLNFGNDYQASIVNWEYDNRDGASTGSVFVKMYQPLPDPVDEKTLVWISRELSPTVIDRLFLQFTPFPPPKIYLRPPNKNVQLASQTGQTVKNATYTSLFSSGALDIINPTDPVIQEWFTDDVGSAELNIDYTDFTNFIFFGSAQSRIDAFVQKLSNIESLTSVLALNSMSLSLTGSANISGSPSFLAVQDLGNQKLELYRSFDSFERFLYYESGSSYSSSFDKDAQDQFYFLQDMCYPKSGSGVVSVSSQAAQGWYAGVSQIAADYDAQNQNALSNNLPAYLQNDIQSSDYLKFFNLIGHHFDTLKTYIDAAPLIYNRDSDPLVGMSPDTVWNVAKSFGVELPNQYAVNSIVDYTIGQSGTSAKVYRHAAAETWKRFLHNQIFMMKTKGTKTALRALVNSYGVLSNTLQIRESATPGVAYPTGSFETYDEQTNAVAITSGSYIKIPWTATSSLSASTLEIRFATTDNSSTMVLGSADNAWAVALQPLTGSFGRVILKNATGVVSVSSSYLPIYTGDFFSTMITYTPSGMSLFVKRTDGAENIVFTSKTQELPSTTSVASSWNTPTYFNLGSSGSYFGRPYGGFVDEVRVWGEVLSESIFDMHVRYPGMYNGNTNYSPANLLYARLSFNTSRNLGITGSYPNESPFVRGAPPIIMNNFSAVGFGNIPSYPNNMSVFNRSVVRYSPNAGGSQWSTNKVIVSPPPVLQYISGSTVPVLSTNKSIVSLDDKTTHNKSTNTIGFFFSITDAINDSIIRSIGNINLQDLIGDPADQFNLSYSTLQQLNDLYWTNYAYNYNTNSFIDFVKNILEPLFSQAKTLIPVRAKLLSGIVHEPTILQRNKLQQKKLGISAGQFSRNKKDTQNLQANPITSHPTKQSGESDAIDMTLTLKNTNSLSGNVEFEDMVIALTDNYDANADISINDMVITLANSLDTSGEVDDYSAIIKINNTVGKISSTFNTFDDSTNLKAYINSLLSIFGKTTLSQLTPTEQALFNELLGEYQNPGIITPTTGTNSGSNDVFFIETIEPFTNFNNVESREYFTNPNGYIGSLQTVYSRRNQNILVNSGSWLRGNSYHRNDFVYQIGNSGSVLIGDNKEFVCVTTDAPFVSQLPPGTDPGNWQPMQYIPTQVLALKQAIIISGSVSIAPTGSGYPIVVGYRPQHYHFTRDTRTRVIRGLFLGCLNTSGSTIDGKQPVTTTFAPNDTLVVTNPGDPILPTDESSGPILSVD